MCTTLLAFDASMKAAGVAYAHVTPYLAIALHYMAERRAIMTDLEPQKLAVAMKSQMWLTAFSIAGPIRNTSTLLSSMHSRVAVGRLSDQDRPALT